MNRTLAAHNTKVAVGAAGLVAALTWLVTQLNLLPVIPAQYVALWRTVGGSVPLLLVYFGGAIGWASLLFVQRPTAALPDGPPVERAGVGAAGSLAAGLAVMMLAAWLLAWAGGLNGWTAWLLPGIGCARWLMHVRQTPPTRWSGSALLGMAGAALLLVGASCPPGSIWRTEAYGYDVLSYHLQVPREWFEAGGMIGLKHNVYSYFPGLFESAFMHLMTMRGSARGAIYDGQFLHAGMAVVAAANLAAVVRSIGGRGAAMTCGGVLLVVPWVMVTGSLAYNEMAMLAFGAAAMNAAMNDRPRAVHAGLACGAATLCKLTAGPMIALPVGAVLLMRRRYRAAAIAAVVGLLVLAPFFVRNAIWTANPLFPFATAVFGSGHWNEELVSRWHGGHFQAQNDETFPEAIVRQWLLNGGYGAVGGWKTAVEVKNIARFGREGGVPVLWIAVVIAGALAWRRHRRLIVPMAVMLAMQIGFWGLRTHMQSRFLVATLLPAVAVLGAGLVEIERRHEKTLRYAAIALVGLLFVLSLSIMLEQTRTVRDERTGVLVNLPPGALAGTLDVFGAHVINEALPAENVKVYLVADSASLLHIRRPMVYHSAFDADPLGELIRGGGDVTAGLRAMGVTHVWIHWQELARLHRTYGFDREVTAPALRKLIAGGWRTVQDVPAVATLYALPAEPSHVR